MTTNHSDQVAIVTGASSGIGEVTARHLHDLGFTVYAVARRVERMTGLADAGIRPVRADLTVDADLVALVDHVMAESGRIDVLVNNAGYGSYGSLEEVSMDEARRQVEVNVFGLARLTQLVIPHQRAQGSGHIVNVSSMGGRFGEPLGSWYHTTKYAVEGMSDSLRPELAPFGIQVVVIQPGAIKTEWGAIAAEGLKAVSGDGPYREQAARSYALLSAAEGEKSPASEPSVIATAIGKAVTARRPKTRYVVGSGAKPLLFARSVLTDRAFDRLMAFAYRAAARRMT